MLRDRRVLLEQEMLKKKQACGALYKKIILEQAEPDEARMYDSMKSELASMMTELAVVDQMIADGHE